MIVIKKKYLHNTCSAYILRCQIQDAKTLIKMLKISLVE